MHLTIAATIHHRSNDYQDSENPSVVASSFVRSSNRSSHGGPIAIGHAPMNLACPAHSVTSSTWLHRHALDSGPPDRLSRCPQDDAERRSKQTIAGKLDRRPIKRHVSSFSRKNCPTVITIISLSGSNVLLTRQSHRRRRRRRCRPRWIRASVWFCVFVRFLRFHAIGPFVRRRRPLSSLPLPLPSLFPLRTDHFSE